MDFTRQSQRAVNLHSTALADGDKICIDYHKGIAHHLPDMTASIWRSTQGGPVSRKPLPR